MSDGCLPGVAEFHVGRDEVASFERAIDLAIRETASEKGNVQLFDSSGALRLVAHRGFDEDFLRLFALVTGTESACGQAAICGALVAVEDVATSPLFAGKPSLAAMQRAGIASVASCPIFNSRQQPLGMISVHRSRPSSWDELGLSRLSQVSQQLGAEMEASNASDAFGAPRRPAEATGSPDNQPRDPTIAPHDDRSATGRLIGAVFSNSSDAVIVVDDVGSIVLASAAITPLFGYYPEELVGESIELLVPDEHRDRHPRHRDSFVAMGRARRMGSGLQLYGLARDGTRLPIDVSLNPTEVGGRRYVAAFVRDATDRIRTSRQLEAANEVTSLLLTGASIDETLRLIMARARELVGGVAAWSAIPGSDEVLSIEAVDGPRTEVLFGMELSITESRAGRVVTSGEIDEVDEVTEAPNVPDAVRALGLGPAIYVPLAHEGARVGVLVIARRRGEPPFDRFDVNLISLFANAASVALVLGTNRLELDRLRVFEEDERIAGGLHDSVIQRAFAIALSLQAVRGFAAGQVLERIDSAVDGLDQLIRELRSSIFRLSGSSASDESA